MKRKQIYLDNAATMRVDKKVVKEMGRFYSQEYGNPSSMHEMGEKAFEAMNNARKKLASEINAKAHEIIFTSGNTESNNLAFFGLARSELGKKRKKIIISAIEHPSIFEICNALKKEGFFIVEIPVDKEGVVDIGRLINETWNIKRSLSKGISNEFVDKLYNVGIKNGAYGGRLLGAGDGGYIMFFHSPKKRNILKKALEEAGGSVMNFGFDLEGVRIWNSKHRF